MGKVNLGRLIPVDATPSAGESIKSRLMTINKVYIKCVILLRFPSFRSLGADLLRCFKHRPHYVVRVPDSRIKTRGS